MTKALLNYGMIGLNLREEENSGKKYFENMRKKL